MPKEIREVDIKAFLSEFDLEWWNKSQFFIYEGTIPDIKSHAPARRTFHVIAAVVSGEIEILINQELFQVKASHFIFLTPSHILQTKAISKDTTFKIILFENTFLAESRHDPFFLSKFSLFSFSSKPVVVIKDTEFHHLISLISYIKINTLDPSRPNRNQVALNLIASFLYELDAAIRPGETEDIHKYSRNEGIAHQFSILLYANFRKEHSVKFYADLLAITPKYLSEVMRHVHGKTAGELMDDALLLEAKVLLSNQELTVGQIADMLYFADQFAFSRYFKKLSGVSPSSYRLK